MFRYSRPFTRPARLFHTSRMLDRGANPEVQAVKFRRPGIRPRNVFIGAVSIYICYTVYNKLILSPLEAAAIEAAKHIPEEELENDDKPLFIPFPGTTKEIKSSPYKGSDPEWQEFIKFSKDDKLVKNVKNELADVVRQAANRHPALSLQCGKGMKLRRVWLDIDYPHIPPPQFERSGIEINDDFIAWTTMPVDSLTVFRVRQALWPSALVQSLWSFTKVLVVDDIRRVAVKLGFQVEPPALSIEQIISRQQELLKKPLPSKDGPPPQSIGDSQRTITSSSTTPMNANSDGKDVEIRENMSPVQKHALFLQSHFLKALMAFKAKFRQTWRPAPNYAPRGSLIVSGFVEVDAPKAVILFDVKAAWDPKTKTFDARTLQIVPRRLSMKRQRPKA